MCNSLVNKYNVAGPRYTSYPTALEFSEKYTYDTYINKIKNQVIGKILYTLTMLEFFFEYFAKEDIYNQIHCIPHLIDDDWDVQNHIVFLDQY